MTRATENDGPGNQPRFPALRVAACGVGFLAAAYVWLGWGYRWDVTARELVKGKPPPGFLTWQGRCVTLHGWQLCVLDSRTSDRPAGSPFPGRSWVRSESRLVVLTGVAHPREAGEFEFIALVFGPHVDPNRAGESFPLHGRVTSEAFTLSLGRGRRPLSRRYPGVDTTAGRLNGMSLIAVVIAFWSAVFLYLWLADWLRARRRCAAILESESYVSQN